MKKLLSSVVCAGILLSTLGGTPIVSANESAINSHVVDSGGQYEKRGYTLEVINDVDNPAMNPIISDFVDLYFDVYPKLLSKYAADPKTATKKVILKFDPTYDGVAYADNGMIVVSSEWILNHPWDLGLFTHELTHIVQAYPRYDDETWWITEGIADYVRYVYGPHHEDWKFTDPKETDNYNGGYGVTARFLLWIEQNKNNKVVDILNKQMQQDTFNINDFKEITGQSVEDLWAEYIKNPYVKTKYKIKSE
ncbi:basic secretory protein-like protein [Paenibacillus sp. VCA1]|uniref:basic secretory protein-like protein n=1 Tax=Paenibacillus sp. VCA1 TaxID=3039148 RepID=UPI002870EAC6|nr:basic secretory protein-like protein [Paenibacillus sp. VCA1]MDR9855489.1 basic secretory protein-like protein [Paenibacillus sp. VCA1]